jgi:peptide/nickel transport system substrate-binding protein
MIGTRGRFAIAGLTVLLAVSACGGKSAPGTGSATPTESLQTTMPAPTSELDKVTWAVYREVGSLDPIYAFDYPENTAVAAMCETLIAQQPDGSTQPALASSVDTSDPTKIVFTLRDGVQFWDGQPLTPADVVYSLQRQMDPKNGGYYGAVFQYVKSIQATGSNQVTIALKQTDESLLGELSSTPGFITEKAYTEQQGAKYGTHAGGAMCTGAFKYQSWKTGGALTLVRNDNYWNTDAPQMVKELDIVGAADEANLTEALKAGEIDATYAALSTLDQLRQADNLQVLQGPSYATADLILNNPSGTLGDPKVRQALSLAIDRQGLLDAVWRGTAALPHAIAGPGTWGYAPDVFKPAYDALPVMDQNLDQAKQLIKDAGAEGKSIVIGMSSEIATLQTEADAVKSAAEEIGLKATEKSVSAAQYIDFFTPNSKIAQQVDGFFTINYPDYADPMALYLPIADPTGYSNYFQYNNPDVVKTLQQAQQTVDPTQRATLVTQAQTQITKDLPWIPLAMPNTTLIINKRLTGAPVSFQYMFGPWAAGLGGTG